MIMNEEDMYNKQFCIAMKKFGSLKNNCSHFSHVVDKNITLALFVSIQPAHQEYTMSIIEN